MLMTYTCSKLTQSEEGEDPLQHGGRLKPPPHGHVNRSEVYLHDQPRDTEPTRRSERSVQKTALTAEGSKSAFILLLLLHILSDVTLYY